MHTPSNEGGRLPYHQTKSGSYFAALYGAEHVAGGEFVIGVAFASWGASPWQVLMGLLLGNTLAVLSWAWVCAPVAVRTRLTLYAYLEHSFGWQMVRVYNVLNGLIFSVIAGGMLTIAALALNALLHGTAQVHWYPTSWVFVCAVLVLGLVMVRVVWFGFEGLAMLSRLSAPWLLAMFLVSGLVSLPFLFGFAAEQGLAPTQAFSAFVWTGVTPDGSQPFGIWHIAAFAWGLNLPLHLGMGDMTTLRFAKKQSYGYYSAFAAFGGHLLAWVSCGVLGATSAKLLQVPLASLDIGNAVLPLLGISGVLAVVVASLTTAVPSFYRACLAFSGLRLGYRRAVLVLGMAVSLMACLPLLFLRWLDIMVYFNIALAPIGAMILVEHFVLPRLGVIPFWRTIHKVDSKLAFWVWGLGLLLAAILIWQKTVHLFFVFFWVYTACILSYGLVAWRQSRAFVGCQNCEQLYRQAYGSDEAMPVSANLKTTTPKLLLGLLGAMVASSLGGFFVSPWQYLPIIKGLLLALSVAYFGSIWYMAKSRKAA